MLSCLALSVSVSLFRRCVALAVQCVALAVQSVSALAGPVLARSILTCSVLALSIAVGLSSVKEAVTDVFFPRQLCSSTIYRDDTTPTPHPPRIELSNQRRLSRGSML